jgi:hypothetical protein
MQSPFHRSIVLVPAGHDDDLVRPVAVLGQAPASPGAELTAAAILDWAQAYCRAQQDPNLLTRADHPLWWALERFHLFTAAGRHEECWRAILAVSCVSRMPSVISSLVSKERSSKLVEPTALQQPSMVMIFWCSSVCGYSNRRTPQLQQLLEVRWPACCTIGLSEPLVAGISTRTSTPRFTAAPMASIASRLGDEVGVLDPDASRAPGTAPCGAGSSRPAPSSPASGRRRGPDVAHRLQHREDSSPTNSSPVSPAQFSLKAPWMLCTMGPCSQHADVGVVLVVLGVAQPVVGDAVAADEGLLAVDDADLAVVAVVQHAEV